MKRVYIVMVHDDKERPYVYGVYQTRELAEETCFRLNRGFNGCGCHADFISEEVIE